MKRTSITLPDELAAALERESRRRLVPISQIMREALADHLGLGGKTRRLPFAALGASGRRTTARDLEEVLAAELARDRGR